MSLLKRTVIHNHIYGSNLDIFINLQAKLLIEQNKNKNSNNIQDYEFKVTSQFGEDGIIQHLISRFPIKNNVFIEFGVEDYKESNTRFLLQNDNWSGLVMDVSKENINCIRNSELYWKHDIAAVDAFITKDNINQLISKNGFNGKVGILSVDVDGVDYWILEAINCVEAEILICEYNSIYGYDRKVTVPHDSSFNRTEKHYSNLYWGASIAALTHLANKKGYSLVGSNSVGNNLFFVSRDYLPIEKQISPQKAYVQSKYRESRDQAGNLTYLNFNERRNLISEMPIIDLDTGKTVTIKDIK
jgi:hypothetical protein